MKIHIEYCVKWNYGPEFERVSNIIKGLHPQTEIKGNEESPRTGAFEVTVNGVLQYSKFSTGKFPEKIEIEMWF